MRKAISLALFLLSQLVVEAQSVQIGDILCTDGTTVSPSQYSTSGKTAMGIVFYIDSNNTEGLAVSLTCQSTNTNWVTSAHYYDMYDIPELENHEFTREAMYDFDGYHNTQAIRNAHGADWYPAAWSVDFDNGWFLPSAGQMRWLMAYINEVNASLDTVHGTTFAFDHPRWYWTSTERGGAHAVTVSQTGSVTYYPKLNYLGDYEIGVRAIKTCHFTHSPSHQIGEIVTAPNGQPGVVYYISPEDDSYWLVAMDDLPNEYPWGPSTDIADLTDYNDNDQFVTLHAIHCGYDASAIMNEAMENNPQYAPAHVNLADGWHIPSAGQLSKLFAALPFIENTLTANGGSTLMEKRYWTSTECSDSKAWSVNFGTSFSIAGIFEADDKANSHPIRPVWSLPCNPPVITINTEFSAKACDSYTWNDSTYTQSGDYQQTFASTQGCDSIVTLHLTIVTGPNVSEIQGEQDIYIESGGLFTYSIDSVPDAFGYDWFIDNGWTVSSTPNSPQCTVNVNTKGRGTLTLRVYCECGVIERTLLIRHDFEAGIKIFPNPNSGKFNIQLYGIEGETVIEVFDYLGQLIDRFEVQSVLHGITIPYSLSGKAAGVYVIGITNGYEHYKKKVVKYYAGSYGMIHY